MTRKTDAEYLRIAFDPDWPEEAKRAAAATSSILDDKASETLFGYQVLAGIDCALTERTSLGAKVRWSASTTSPARWRGRRSAATSRSRRTA